MPRSCPHTPIADGVPWLALERFLGARDGCASMPNIGRAAHPVARGEASGDEERPKTHREEALKCCRSQRQVPADPVRLPKRS